MTNTQQPPDEANVRTPSEAAAADDDTAPFRATELQPQPAELSARNRPALTVVAGPECGRMIAVGDGVTIGRGVECEARVDDSSISRQHARVVHDQEKGVFRLVDLGSLNGTYVEGKRVETAELSDGARIQLGPTVELRFSLVDDVEERVLQGLYESSIRDPLTGAHNRRHFGERLLAEIAFALRHRTEVGLLLIDLDHFKRVNDEYGHLAGDAVLQKLSSLVMKMIRTEDVFARYGGEEFAVIVRGIEAGGVVALAERVRTAVEKTVFSHEGVTIPVTVSVGAATLSCLGKERALEMLIDTADRRLYEAKGRGRNRTVGPLQVAPGRGRSGT